MADTVTSFLEAIQYVMVAESEDTSTLDKDLWCTRCGTRLRSIEDGDYLECLVDTAFDHLRVCAG